MSWWQPYLATEAAMVKSAAGFLISGSWIATEAVVGKVVGIATAEAVGRCWCSLPFSLTILGTATSVTGIRGGAGPTKITGGLHPILQILLAGHAGRSFGCAPGQLQLQPSSWAWGKDTFTISWAADCQRPTGWLPAEHTHTYTHTSL